VHSPHGMRAYFSSTDDHDETARRIYGVLGRLDTPTPQVALRVATGCRPHATECVRFAQVFAGGLGSFRDMPFSEETAEASGDGASSSQAAAHRRSTPSPLLSLAVSLAEDLAAIRAHIETRHGPGVATAPFWTP